MAKQPGTGLERATKSIPLSGGITEEVDDFLLEPAGMQYMENLRYTKTDQAEKARGRATGVATGVTNHTADSYGLWSQGDTVAVVGNDKIGVSRDAGATFEQYTQPTDLLGIESVLRTAESSGGNNYSWAPIWNYTAGSPDTYVTYGYVVAFERVTHLSGSIANTRQCIVQIYDLEGQLAEETVFNSRGAPKCHAMDTKALINMVTSAGYVYAYTVDSTLELSAAITSTSRSVQDYCQVYSDTNEGYGNVGAEEEFNIMRLGYSRDLRANNYAFDAWHSWDYGYGVQAWKDGAGNIKAVRTVGGIPTGSTATVQSDSATLFGKLLDVTYGGGYIWVLYAKTRNATGVYSQSDIFITRYSTSMVSPSTYQFVTSENVEVVNGSCRVDSVGNMHVAMTWAYGKPVDNQFETQGRHQIQWYEFAEASWPTPSTVASGDLYSHRLCSDLVIDKDDNACAAVQQWDNWNPGSGGTVPYSADIPAFTPTHKKPVTTSLVCFKQGSNYNKLLGTFDAGQSKACLAGSDEQSMHMGGELYYRANGDATGSGSHEFFYGNRVLLGATDDLYQLYDTTDKLFPSSDGRAALHSGSSRFSCYRLASDLQVNQVNFTNGMFMGTAIPTWYDGSTTICSMQPIDSPEVVGFDDITSGGKNMGSYGAYQDLVAANESAKVVNLVAGYYDDAGLVHRSAPSHDFYIGRTKASETDGTALRVWFTPPLGLARNRDYFVEAYEAWPGGVPQLAATRQLNSNAASTVQYIDWASNLAPQSTADLDVTDFRSARTIYTAGNILAADPWPNFDAVVKSGRRLFAHSISDPATIFYSKTFESGVAPEFSASLTVSIGNEKITALGAIDDKVIIFTADSCWVMYGTGPDNTGANGDFFIEQMVFPIGCTDQQSIMTMENGIAFYSSTTEEFHVFSRDLQLVDIGEAVKTVSENITDVVDSIVVPNDHEIRWYCTRTVGPEYVADSATNSPPQPPRPFLENQAPAGAIFVYNYKYQKWSILEDAAVRTERVQMIGCCVGELADDWDLYKEADTAFTRLCKWETPWIKVNQLQDFGRFYGLTFLGKYMSSWSGTPVEAGDLQVTIRYDYEGALGATDVHRFRANVDFDPADGDRLQFRVRPKRQKCQAIKIQIEEVATTAVELWEPTYTTGQGIILTAVDVHYGAKGGSGDKSLGAQRKKG